MRIAVAVIFAVLMPIAESAQAGKLMHRTDYIDYVCGERAGQSKTYLNVYFARNDGATDIRPGRCEDQPYRR
jgi:hypothetical protein